MRREWFAFGKKVHALMPVGCPNYPIRLYHRDKKTFNDDKVHEPPVGYSSVGRIESILEHHTFQTKSEFKRKLDHYSDLKATQLRKRTTPHIVYWIKQWSSPIGAFLKWYIKSGSWRVREKLSARYKSIQAGI